MASSTPVDPTVTPDSSRFFCSVVPDFLVEAIANSDEFSAEARDSAQQFLKLLQNPPLAPVDAADGEDDEDAADDPDQDPGQADGGGDTTGPVTTGDDTAPAEEPQKTDGATNEDGTEAAGGPVSRSDTDGTGAGQSPAPLPTSGQSAPQNPPTFPWKVTRRVFDLKGSPDLSRLPGTRVRVEGDPVNKSRDPAVNDVFNNLGLVSVFYNRVLHRSSFDGVDGIIKATVHCGGNKGLGAWNGKQLIFDDGGIIFGPFTNALDIIGHEVTHGLIDHTAMLAKFFQPGALNESICDVFGVLALQYSRNQLAKDAAWTIGESTVKFGNLRFPIRSMKNPGSAFKFGDYKDLQVGHYRDWVTQDASRDGGGIHKNSGIPNRAFYLAAIGLGGHAWDRAGPIWYAVLTGNRIHPNCTFLEFARLTVDTAEVMFGQRASFTVYGAWTQVGVVLK